MMSIPEQVRSRERMRTEQVLHDLEEFRWAVLAYYPDSFSSDVQKSNPFASKHRREAGNALVALRQQVSEDVRAVDAKPTVSTNGHMLCRDDAGYEDSYAYVVAVANWGESRPFDMVMFADNLPAGIDYPRWLVELLEDAIWKYCKVACRSISGWGYILRRPPYLSLFPKMAYGWAMRRVRGLCARYAAKKREFWENVNRVCLIVAIVAGLAGIVSLAMYILDRPQR